MSIKALIYCIVVPIIIWILDGIEINKKIYRIIKRIIDIIGALVGCVILLPLTIGISYLVVNFFYDFFLNSAFIN